MIAALRAPVLLQLGCIVSCSYHCYCRAVLEVKLSYDGEHLSSVMDVGEDILIIPQASIGGKLKGKSVQ